MYKIDDLISVNKVITSMESLNQKIRRYYQIERELELLQEEYESVSRSLDNFEYTEESESYLQAKSIQLEENMGGLRKEMEELGSIDSLQTQHEEKSTEVDESLRSLGINDIYEFEETKRKYLGNLLLTEHISAMVENPEAFFKKLIELYGEKNLAQFTYLGEETEMLDDFEDEHEYEEDEGYEEDYDDFNFHYPCKISNFIFGEEDKIIGSVSDTTLRETILASKLEFMNSNGIGDISQYMQEYVDGVKGHTHNEVAFLDEFGNIDIEDTLANFSMLPISKDKNFYLYLAKYLDEMQLPFETFLQYINPDMLDQEFRLALTDVANTKQVHGYLGNVSDLSQIETDKALLEWLEGKNERLSALENEQKIIVDAKKLIERQNDGQNKGEY